MRTFEDGYTRCNCATTRVLPRSNCLVGVNSPRRRRHEGDISTFLSRVHHYRRLKLSQLGFRPNSRLHGVDRRSYLHLVTSNVGCTLSRAGNIATMVRGATNRNSGLNCHFRRLHTLVSVVSSGDHINIYVSARRTFTSNCSLSAPRSFRHM